MPRFIQSIPHNLNHCWMNTQVRTKLKVDVRKVCIQISLPRIQIVSYVPAGTQEEWHHEDLAGSRTYT